MGKPSGFMEYGRENNQTTPPEERIQNYCEFHPAMSLEDRRTQAARCMDCGVPFCQTGIMLGGMVTGCPLNNLIPEWNDMIYRGSMPYALSRLLKTNNFPEFTGRVCPAPCEAACTCSLHGDPVTIRENELAVIEYAFGNGLIQPRTPAVRTGKRWRSSAPAPRASRRRTRSTGAATPSRFMSGRTARAASSCTAFPT